MIVISFALVKFYAFAILYVLIVMQIKLVVVVVVMTKTATYYHLLRCFVSVYIFSYAVRGKVYSGELNTAQGHPAISFRGIPIRKAKIA